MAAPTSVPPSTGSSSPRQRQRYRYRLPHKRKKHNPTKLTANIRTLIVVGVLLISLLVALVVIAFNLVPSSSPY